MKVWIMWIPEASNGPSIAISPEPPERERGTYYFSSKKGSFGCTMNNGYKDIFEYLYKTYVDINDGLTYRDVKEIEI